MAQKDKVKELVGRSLNSYHTKSLQQIDRIEKKNKEQNHKISILSNELDNDYLTKTEEGSVISLEHSKEGMVYLDELQGNTLVNYCTDGSKEMTLNGDIDIEGVSVTTTEGVDGGKIDVMCEGNTLVNKLYKIKDYGSNTEFKNHGWGSTSNCPNYEWIDNGIKIKALSSDTRLDRYYRSSPDKHGIFKKNRTYIVRMNVNSNDLKQNATILRCFYGNGTTFITGQMSEVVNGVFIKKATTSSTIEEVDAIHSMISLDYRTPQGVDGWVSFQNVMVIDVTDLPSYQQDVEYWRNMNYFEGMKSVGQDDENGHKIEILSQNKNLCKSDLVNIGKFMNTSGQLVNNETQVGSDFIQVVGGENIVSNLPNINYFKEFDINKKHIRTIKNSSSYTISKQAKYITFNFHHDNPSLWVQQNQVNISYGSTLQTYTEGLFNKKEILINEPLRAVGNVKDKFVKIGNKYFIERNCAEVCLDGSKIPHMNDEWLTENQCVFHVSNITHGREPHAVISNSFKAGSVINTNQNIECIQIGGSGVPYTNVYVKINKSRLTTVNSEGVKTYLQANPIRLVYILATPTYEPVQIEPVLNTYNDITHISNNSIIPCNMKIKNTGYNAIIKPSTLYTIALDTNKGGTVGMNLGGVKGTTTNNVLKLTTPATLADDSLRLYGKGIKGSKVRLLEGDKTNWIPSHFEGMKSSFEDKVQSDGSYKMEISSNNKNLLGLDFYSNEHRVVSINGATREINGNTFKVSNNNSTTMDCFVIHLYDLGKVLKKSGVYTLSFDILERTGGYDAGIYLIRYLESSFTGGYIPLKYHSLVSYKPGDRVFIQFDYLNYSLEEICFRLNVNSPNSSVKIGNIQIEEGTTTSNYIPQNSNKIQFSSIEPLRSVKNIKDKFVFKDGKLMIERNCIERDLTRTLPWSLNKTIASSNGVQFVCRPFSGWGNCKPKETEIICSKKPTLQNDSGNHSIWVYDKSTIVLQMNNGLIKSVNDLSDWLDEEKPVVVVPLAEPIYEEIPFELQKIILEGYENGTLFFDTNIPPTTTVRYAGETPIVKATKLNKTEVLNNTNDINDNIIPYLMDMDYRVVCLQLQSENINDGVSMARLFGGTYEMLQRDIQSKRYSVDEYKHRLDAYLDANKITEEEYNKLGDMLNE